MNTLKKILCILLPFLTQNIQTILPDYGHIYCTCSDENHYDLLLGFIGSIHEADFENLNQIAVFDLGFSPEQRKQLETIDKVSVYDLEMSHPDLLTLFVTSPWGRMVRGWFAWKAVAIKQALDIFPYCLYADAGTLILKSPHALFDHIREHGYFFMDVGHNITDRITKQVIVNIINPLTPEQQLKILSSSTSFIDAGFQGISRTIYDTYIYPMYKHTYNLELFADDGSAQLGFGQARHDQTIFSIYAHILNMKIHPCGWISFDTNQKISPFHIHWDRSHINSESLVYRCRQDINCFGKKEQFIHYK